MDEPTEELAFTVFVYVVYRWSPCVYWEDDGYHRDENGACVSVLSVLIDSVDTYTLIVGGSFCYCRSLIANFEFELAYEGQMPKPTAAVTMSELGSCLSRENDLLFSDAFLFFLLL